MRVMLFCKKNKPKLYRRYNLLDRTKYRYILGDNFATPRSLTEQVDKLNGFITVESELKVEFNEGKYKILLNDLKVLDKLDNLIYYRRKEKMSFWNPWAEGETVDDIPDEWEDTETYTSIYRAPSTSMLIYKPIGKDEYEEILLISVSPEEMIKVLNKEVNFLTLKTLPKQIIKNI